MEVAIEDATNFPGDHLLAIRYGSMRHLIEVSNATTEPVLFPASPCPANIKVDLLAKLGSAWLVMQPGEDTYRLPLMVSGEAQSRTLSLRINLLSAEGDVKREASLRPNIAGAGEVLDGSPSKLLNVEMPFKNSAALDAKAYMEKHKLDTFMHALLHAVIRERPDEPYKFLATQFVESCSLEAKSEELHVEVDRLHVELERANQALEVARQEVEQFCQMAYDLDKELQRTRLEHHALWAERPLSAGPDPTAVLDRCFQIVARPTVGDMVTILDTSNTRMFFPYDWIGKQVVIYSDRGNTEPFQIQGCSAWLDEDDVQLVDVATMHNTSTDPGTAKKRSVKGHCHQRIAQSLELSDGGSMEISQDVDGCNGRWAMASTRDTTLRDKGCKRLETLESSGPHSGILSGVVYEV